MYCSLTLYTEPKRPLINPKFDLFAWLDFRNETGLLFPAKVIDTVQVMLPDKCAKMVELPTDMFEFVKWQAEEKGYTVVRSIDPDWLYWSMLADKYTLLNMVKLLV